MSKLCRTILVIDGATPSNHDYECQLQQELTFSYRVLTEQYGNAIPTLCRSQQVDGILLDLYSSPKLKPLTQLRQALGEACPPIVVIGGEDVELAVQAFKQGAVDYLVKTRMTWDDLRLTMRSAIENAELRQELQRSQERFHTSVENMLDCYGIFSSIRNEKGQIVDFRIDYLNQAACENNHMAKTAQIGRGLCELLPAHRETGLFDEYCRVVETGEPLIKDSLVYEDTFAGQRLIRAFDIRATKLNDGFVASWRDITDRKHLEEELSQTAAALQVSEQCYRNLAEAMPAIVWTADATGAVNYWNQRWYEYTGLSEAESLGGASMSTIHPQERDRTFAQWNHAIRDGEGFEIEYRIRRWDGVYHWFICQSVPTRNDQGQITGWIGTIMNIHDQKQLEARLLNEIVEHQQTEQELQTANQRLSSVLDNTLDAIVMLDPDWHFTYANQTAIDAISQVTYLAPAEWLSRSLWEIFPSLVGQPTEQAYRRAMLERVPVQVEVFYEPTGNWFEAQAYPSAEAGITINFRNIDDRKQTEATLQANQEQLQQQLAEIEAIYQTAPIGLNVLDRDLRFIRINQRLAEMNGFSAEAHIGRTIRELLPELADAAEALLCPILETGEPRLNVEIHGETPAQPGVQRTWLEHFLPLKDGDRVIGISTVCEEITDRKRTEAALRENEEFKRRMLESSSDCIKVLDLDARLLYMNPGGQCLLEIEDFGCFYNANWIGFWQGEDRLKAEHAVAGVKAGGMERFQGYCPTAKGTPKWWDVVLTPIQNAAGQLIQILSISRDMTEQKLAEEALKQSQERLKLGMQVSGFALARVDYATDTIELSSEAARLYGLPEDDLIVPRERLHATFHPEERAEMIDLIEQVLDPAGSGWFSRDHRVVWPNGEVRWLTVRKQVFFAPSGVGGAHPTQTPAKPLYAILVALDITKRKQVEQERERLLAQEQTARETAERANRIKDEFLAILSHELRTPLNPILGWATLLQNRQFDAVRTAEALATIERNAKLQMQLIDDLLDMAKILRGKLSLEPIPVDLSVVVGAAIETVRTAATAKNIAIHTDLPKPEPVMGDAARLQQVVWNLLSNAIKFTPQGGQVTVSLRSINAQVELTITDTGKGIKPEFLPYLFESFRQEDASTTRQYGGLGLGLAIVRQLVEAHGGVISAYSLGEGYGATFTVHLPLLNTGAEVNQLSEMAKPELDLAGVRVLAVDDDLDSCELLTFILTEYGAEVKNVSSAAEVLEILDSFQPDLLISDIGMPDMDGYALIQQIRSRPPERGGQVKAIALTAYAREDDQQRALACGYQQHVTKPFDLEELIQVVVSVMRAK